jgi:hypothetical protein
VAIDELDPSEIREIDRGLAYLGWATTHRLTSDDTLILGDIAARTVRMECDGKLGESEREVLALEAYDILKHYHSGPDRRSWAVKTRILKAPMLSALIRLIDEATLAFLRRYHTASFALLLVVLENYLRQLSNWKPGDKDVSFKTLQQSISKFEPSREQNVARDLVDKLYSRYDAISPSAFLFNRHGLLHGLRTASDFDEMNCARVFFLFDLLAACEGTYAAESSVDLRDKRHAVYYACFPDDDEMELLVRT